MVILVAVTAAGTAARAGEFPQDFSFDSYAGVLKSYVDDDGMVDYAELKANRKGLDDFAESVARLNPKTYDSWSDREKIAFWINVYNALTLKVIIDHYPIHASYLKTLVYPKNSIRQIPGVWQKITFPVMGRDMTLDHIEHEILRARFDEPRIHMALVCAAKGCPPLRREPYTGSRLNEQLDDQTVRFIKNKEKFRLDRSADTVFVSSIFDWFGSDFEKKYDTDKAFRSFSERERAVLNFISHYLDEADRKYLTSRPFSIDYLRYDWSLNEKSKQTGPADAAGGDHA
jgi:hypothetical protein